MRHRMFILKVKFMNPTRVLTRYMPFLKLLSILEHGFFIPKATLFSDELEGVLPYFREINVEHGITREEIKKAMDWVYISCWHSEPHECHAMWQIYGQSSEAIAIQTTEFDLKLEYFESKTNMHAYLDEVEYKKHEDKKFSEPKPVVVLQSNEANSMRLHANFAALFSYLKHSGYWYEREMRLVAIDPNACIEKTNPSDGYRLPVSQTKSMIKNILIHPNSPVWFENLVKDVVKYRYQMSVSVLRSSLSEKVNPPL
jgi:Protein of unknown function (DUF2971)